MTAGPDPAPVVVTAPTSHVATGAVDTRPGRLRKRAEFLAAAKGRRFRTDRLTVQALPRSQDPDAGLRIGFTVTRREGRAVQRNRIRRRLRAAIARAAGPHLGRPVDLVIVGRTAAMAAPFDQLVDDLAAALARLVATPKSGGGRPPARSPDV